MNTTDASPAPGRPGPLDRLLGLFSEVRPGEGARALLMLVNVFLILVSYYVIKTVREPLILGTEVPGFLQALGIHERGRGEDLRRRRPGPRPHGLRPRLQLVRLAGRTG